MAEYCSDEFKMTEDTEDSFRMWQGLVGPYYTPYVSGDGTLSFSNNGDLPNPSPVNVRGPQGAGIRIAGIVSTEAALPETAAAGDIWLVGAESPYEGFSFINGQWIDLGPLTVGPAGPPGPQGDDYILQESDKQEIAEIAEQVLLSELDETPLAIRYGGTGARTVAGAKEALGIDEIETKLGTWPLGTDAQDVAGAVNEMIGEIALQVDDIQKLKDDLAAEFSPDLTYAVGSYCVYSGILYRCISAVTTPGSWTGSANWTEVKAADEIKALREDVEDLDAGDIDFDSSATYAAGTVGKELVEQKNTLNQFVRPNLLDNWYFVYGRAINNDYSSNGTFPINQRGQQSYTSAQGYGIDRWFNHGQNTMTVHENGIECGFIRQKIEKYYQYYGKTATLSMLRSDGTLMQQTGTIASSGSSLEIDDGSIKLYLYADPNTSLSVCIENATVKAVKLELGSGQTLAHWDGTKWVLNEIPNYGEELAKCQRYQWVIGPGVCTVGLGIATTSNNIMVIINPPITFNKPPNVTFVGDGVFCRNGETYVASSTVSELPTTYDFGPLHIGLGVSGATPGAAYEVYLNSTAKMILDANL